MANKTPAKGLPKQTLPKVKLPKIPDHTMKKLSVVLGQTSYYLRLAFLLFVKTFRKVIFRAQDIDLELRKRILTSLVFIFVLLFAITAGNIIYNVLMMFVVMAMVFEITKMCRNIENEEQKIIIKRTTISYVIVSMFSLIMIRSFTQGLKITLWTFFVVWSVDACAYIFGKKYGRIKIAPTISPGKTYEGAIFGSVSGVLMSMVLYSSFYTDSESSFSSISFLTFSIIIVVLAQLGDLAESYVKRQCHVKDSGKFLPGHGGVCDRFDSLLFVAPLVFLMLILNGGILF